MPPVGAPDVKMDDADEVDFDVARYKALIAHVFLPPQLPAVEESADDLRDTSTMLCSALLESAEDYMDKVEEEQRAKWGVVVKMIKKVRAFVQTPMTQSRLASVLEDMDVGGT